LITGIMAALPAKTTIERSRTTQKAVPPGGNPERRQFKHFLRSTQLFRSQIVDVVAGVHTRSALAEFNSPLIRVLHGSASALPRHGRGSFGIPFFLEVGFERVEIVVPIFGFRLGSIVIRRVVCLEGFARLNIGT
jgi:hypothetical protein